MTKAAWIARRRRTGAVALVLLSTSCGTLTRQGQASSYLIIDTLQGASGATPGTFGGVLASDVVTIKDNVSSTFNDIGQVQFSLGLKDPGPVNSVTPSQANFITVDRYHVAFIRADGRNTQGVDVPYAFDGAFTVTVSDKATVGFTLVRNQAKDEAPLRALGVNGQVISTIAQVDFYGHDQTGREVMATGRIGIDFANFGDPK